MKENKKFIEQHPGLKGRGLDEFETFDNIVIMDELYYKKKDIHKTQIDKIKLNKAIDDLHIVGIMRTKGRLMISVEELKEKLGL